MGPWRDIRRPCNPHADRYARCWRWDSKSTSARASLGVFTRVCEKPTCNKSILAVYQLINRKPFYNNMRDGGGFDFCLDFRQIHVLVAKNIDWAANNDPALVRHVARDTTEVQLEDGCRRCVNSNTRCVRRQSGCRAREWSCGIASILFCIGRTIVKHFQSSIHA